MNAIDKVIRCCKSCDKYDSVHKICHSSYGVIPADPNWDPCEEYIHSIECLHLPVDDNMHNCSTCDNYNPLLQCCLIDYEPVVPTMNACIDYIPIEFRRV